MSDFTASAKAMEKEKTNDGESTPVVKKREKRTAPSFNMSEIRELADLVNEHGFTDFEFENENIRVRLSKMPAVPFAQSVPSYPAFSHPASSASVPQPAESTTSKTEETPEQESDLFAIVSPIVGTFYRSPGPDKEPYVREGSMVGPDTVVCIVEAMKLMNEIQAETTGEIVKIYVENGQPVEYGQPLFGIRK